MEVIIKAPRSRRKALPWTRLSRGRPRDYQEWKALKRWNKLPCSEVDPPGYVLRLVRENAGLTQTELAELLRVSQQAVAQAERFESNPTVRFCMEWGKACSAPLVMEFTEDP